MDIKAHSEYLLDLRLNNQNLLASVVYKPPNVRYADHIEVILAPHTALYDHVVLMGDFNTDLFKSNNQFFSLRDMLKGLNLHILPLNATHHPRTSSKWPDLVIVSNVDKVVNYAAECLPWKYVATAATVDKKVDIFSKSVLNVCYGFAPLVNKRVIRAPAPWLTQEIRALMVQRDPAFREYKKA
ncbi:hypothetical protein PR048_007914 [Dryococelus australis]|uniref:Endonuclease/exonuclease/phosphatase domain-containing protein n=1 Tax=Dryococelus australis TaxID=614101 RepID=A0ABQ9HVL0_9NEOP|nr:hypothetical protein PR048_007914 [Dryococelus australis]